MQPTSPASRWSKNLLKTREDFTAGSPTDPITHENRQEIDLNHPPSRELCEPAVDFFRGGVDFEAPTYHEIQLCLNRFSASLRILAEEDALDAWY